MFDIIIGHSESDKYRTINLLYILKYYLNKCPYSNIIVVEQNTNTSINEHKRINHIKIENKSSLYNRGLGFNIGVNYSTKNHILLIDNDCIIDPIFLNIIHKHISEITALIPYSICIDLNQIETNYLIKTNKIIGGKSRGIKNSCVGGSLIMSRDAYIKVGGYEEMFGWGCEDECMFHKMNKLIGVNRPTSEIPMFHLYHPRASTIQHLESEVYKKNLEKLEMIKNMNKEQLLKYLGK